MHKLVERKQAWAIPLDEGDKAKGFLGWHQRGYLPHYDAPGLTQMVTLYWTQKTGSGAARGGEMNMGS